MSTIGNVAVREDPAAEAIRRRINFIEGANVTITVADDPTNHEVDVTIASAGATASAWLSQFFPAEDIDDSHGTYATVNMVDGEDITVRQTFMLPEQIVTVTRAVVIVIPEGTGDLRWTATTNFAQICADEDYQTHTDVTGPGVTAVTTDEVECINFAAALTNAVGGDLVGLEFVRSASNAADTVDADVHYIGILIQGEV